MIPRLFAFDLDGTLLDSRKRISAANIAAIRDMAASGAAVALASGRLGAGVRRYVPELGIDPALVTLNGAEVFTGSGEGAERVYYAPLAPERAEYLTRYGVERPVAVNFYWQDRLYTVKTDGNVRWTELYHQQTGVDYNFLDDFAAMEGVSPSKIIFVGDPAHIDVEEARFRALWDDGSVYVCRSWDHYLEFMDPKANKGLGLAAVCAALGVGLSEAAAYGDAENDMPMLSAAGFGAAMKNAPDRIKRCAARVTELTNEEDWVAREWERIKTLDLLKSNNNK